MKKILALILTLTLVLLIGCTKIPDKTVPQGNQPGVTDETPTQRYTVKIAGLMGPTGMGMAHMFKSDDNLNDYDYEISSDPSELGPKVLKGELDMAAVPTNVAATIYNKSEGKIKVVALNTLSVLYILEQGEKINKITDLKGRTVYCSGQGATPEYILSYLCTANGLKVGKDVKFNFTYNNHADLAKFAVANKPYCCMLPEPNVTAVLAKNNKMRVALDLGRVWEETVKDDSKIVMGCVIVNTAFAEKNKEAVENFLKDYKSSVEKVNAQEIVDLSIIPSVEIAEKAIPRCNIVCITGENMKEKSMGFFKVLYEANPASVGGKLPDDEFFYN
ncbi:MAG: ABC transporter substrate-binding protein [Ruminococcaceae bacterium]|nr:ABC transporter substrate-binding protein [Oscillospiraceae bacterium]